MKIKLILFFTIISAMAFAGTCESNYVSNSEDDFAQSHPVNNLHDCIKESNTPKYGSYTFVYKHKDNGRIIATSIIRLGRIEATVTGTN